MALTLVTISPAIFGSVLAPVLTHIVEIWGWRVGYRVLAAFILMCSLIAITLVPAGDQAAKTISQAKVRPARTDFRLILRSAPFWIIFAAMFLCTLQTPLHASQMGMMLRDNRLDAAQAAAMISVYGLGTIIGRFTCGLALDRFPTPIVAAISMVLPALGFVLLAIAPGQPLWIGVAMFLVGISFGAEGDLQSFLVARHFDLRIFSTTLSLVIPACSQHRRLARSSSACRSSSRDLSSGISVRWPLSLPSAASCSCCCRERPTRTGSASSDATGVSDPIGPDRSVAFCGGS